VAFGAELGPKASTHESRVEAGVQDLRLRRQFRLSVLQRDLRARGGARSP